MRTILILIALAASNSVVLANPKPAASSNPYVGTPEYKLSAARVDAVRKAYTAALTSWKNGQGKLDDVYVWSIRVLEAERDQTVQLDRDQVLKDNVKRMHDLEATVKAQQKQGLASSSDLDLVTYYRIDADLRYAYERTP